MRQVTEAEDAGPERLGPEDARTDKEASHDAELAWYAGRRKSPLLPCCDASRSFQDASCSIPGVSVGFRSCLGRLFFQLYFHVRTK